MMPIAFTHTSLAHAFAPIFNSTPFTSATPFTALYEMDNTTNMNTADITATNMNALNIKLWKP